MGTPVLWPADQFGCILQDGARAVSQMRTEITSTIPVPLVSRKGDTSAPLELAFTLDVPNAGARAFEQWWTYDLHDGALPFLVFIPWGIDQVQVRARLMGEWTAARIDSVRWKISASMQIDRDSLPRFSGGADA